MEPPTSPARIGPDPDMSVDAVMTQLRSQGGRSTATRRIILQELIDAGGSHVTAEQLTESVQRSHPGVPESTVYRTLERFEDMGVAHHVHLGHGPAVWHLNRQPRRYLTCNRCGASYEVDPGLFAALERRLQNQYGFTADLGHFATTGTCQACAGAPKG